MKIGFIGLGIMGKPMAKNLIKGGNQVVVYTKEKAVIDELVIAGASAATSSADVARKAEVIITMLPNSPDVRAVVLGKDGIIEGAKAGTVVIDMSSIDPVQSREIGKAMAESGLELLDAPVSGGEPKAIDGTLSVMVGGNKETFDKYKSLLEQMAASVVYVGELGNGNVAKLANQMIVAINIAAVSEAMVFAKKAGADPQLVYEAIRGGLAGSTVMDAKVPMMLERNFKPGFRIELHLKDLNNVIQAGTKINQPIPLTTSVFEMMKTLKNSGYEKEDHSSLLKYFESISNIEL